MYGDYPNGEIAVTSEDVAPASFTFDLFRHAGSFGEPSEVPAPREETNASSIPAPALSFARFSPNRLAGLLPNTPLWGRFRGLEAPSI